MDKETKEDKKDFEEWLLNFGRTIGKGVVVSLLIDHDKIEFVSCVDRRRYLGEEHDADDDKPDIDIHHKENMKQYVMHTERETKRYIG